MSCIQKMKSQTGNKPQVEGRQSEEGRDEAYRTRARWMERSIFPGGGGDPGPGRRWERDCSPLALSPRGNSVLCRKVH